MCVADAVLQLLVHSPPFGNMLKELDDLNGQRVAGGLETGGGATLLVDATVRFFEEFMFKEKEPPPMQQEPQEPEDEEAKAIGSFEPTYLYDAMKEKRQLKSLLVRFHNQDAAFCY
jgi:ubiquitin carboxyl-terminal hydrolase 10